MNITDKIQVFNESCFDRMSLQSDGSIDVICVDPPYLYLKHELDVPFDEQLFFSECKRLLTKNGFIILFGRGASFYRWGAILHELGFSFKEEIIWDKSQNSSPLMALSRVHETVSIWCKGKGSINKCKIPYLEMKGHDLYSIVTDVKRLKTVFNNTKSLNAVIQFLENNTRDTSDNWGPNQISISSGITKEDRSVSVIRGIKDGLNEKTIVRTDVTEYKFKHNITTSNKIKNNDRCVDVCQQVAFGLNEKSIIKQYQDKGITIASDKVGKVLDSVVDMGKIVNGMNEKSIINTADHLLFIKTYYSQLLDMLQESGQTTIYKELRDHYTSIHPTQKPVRLLERLLQLVIPKGQQAVTVADWFGGSYSTMKAVHNMGYRGISTELLEKFHTTAVESLKDHCKQLNIFSK